MKNKIFNLFLICFLFLEAVSFTVGSINIKLYQLFVPFIFILIIAKNSKISSIKVFELLYLFLYTCLFFTMIYANDAILAIRLVILEIILIITYFYIRIEFAKFTINDLENKIILIGKFYVLGSLLFYVLGLFKLYYAPINGESSYFGLFKENILFRLRGFAESPNTYILYGLFFLVFFIYAKDKKFIILSVGTILLSFSTTGILAMFLVFLIYFLYHRKFFTLVKLSSLFLSISAIIYFYFIYGNQEIMKMITWRLERNKTGSNRFELWHYTINLISERPIFGYGINQTRDLIKNFMELNSVHNTFLEVFLTSGAIGLFLYILLLAVLFVESIKITKYMKDSKMILLFVVLVMSSMANNTLHIGYMTFYLAIFYQYLNKIHYKFKMNERLSIYNNTNL